MEKRSSKLNLLLAHSNSYEIKLAVAVSPTISNAPSTAPHYWQIRALLVDKM